MQICSGMHTKSQTYAYRWLYAKIENSWALSLLKSSMDMSFSIQICPKEGKRGVVILIKNYCPSKFHTHLELWWAHGQKEQQNTLLDDMAAEREPYEGISSKHDSKCQQELLTSSRQTRTNWNLNLHITNHMFVFPVNVQDILQDLQWTSASTLIHLLNFNDFLGFGYPVVNGFFFLMPVSVGKND